MDPTALPGAEGGGAAVVEIPYVPDFVSLVPEGADLAVLVRVDVLRGSQVAPIIQEVLRSEPGEARMLLEAGVDPLQDVDRVLVAGRERANGPDVVAIEHRWSEQQLFDVYARVARVPPEAPAEVQMVGRFRVVTRPGARLSLVLLTPTVAAFVPPEQVAPFAQRAEAVGSDASETGRRLRMVDALAPDLAPTAAVRVSAESGGGQADWSRELSQLGLPPPAWVAVIAALDDGASGFVRAGYASGTEAAMTEGALRSLLSQSFHPLTLLLRVMGLGRAIQATQVSAEGSEVTFRTHLTPDELERVIDRLRTGGP